MNTQFSNVYAVIVTFNPSPSHLRDLIDRALPQVGQIVLVDNGSNASVRNMIGFDAEKIVLLELGRNCGLAAAQNIAIERALRQGAQHVLFFDQDSTPQNNMVELLMQASFDLKSSGIAVGAVGPRFLDLRKGDQAQWGSEQAAVKSYIPKPTLIASGCLISAQTLRTVGLMKSELFIDYVDLEWCLRAGALGYQHFQIDHVQMLHVIGGEPIVFMGKNWPSHSALRHYYMFRNAIWMYKQSYISWRWKWIDGFKLIRKFIFYSLFAKPWAQQVKMMLRGLFDGFIGKMGAFSDAHH